MGEAIAKEALQHNTILMSNHGVVSWGFGVEDAYFKMEILEAYCKTVLVATQLGQLGHAPNTIPSAQMNELMAIKQTLGIPDPRLP
jgi:L-fuculose-phosphate aldolase